MSVLQQVSHGGIVLTWSEAEEDWKNVTCVAGERGAHSQANIAAGNNRSERHKDEYACIEHTPSKRPNSKERRPGPSTDHDSGMNTCCES